MMMEKQYIGQCELSSMTICYYVIKQGNYYGVELLETQDEKLTCTSELISEVQETALSLAEKLLKNNVTSTTLIDIIDDHIN